MNRSGQKRVKPRRIREICAQRSAPISTSSVDRRLTPSFTSSRCRFDALVNEREPTPAVPIIETQRIDMQAGRRERSPNCSAPLAHACAHSGGYRYDAFYNSRRYRVALNPQMAPRKNPATMACWSSQPSPCHPNTCAPHASKRTKAANASENMLSSPCRQASSKTIPRKAHSSEIVRNRCERCA